MNCGLCCSCESSMIMVDVEMPPFDGPKICGVVLELAPDSSRGRSRADFTSSHHLLYHHFSSSLRPCIPLIHSRQPDHTDPYNPGGLAYENGPGTYPVHLRSLVRPPKTQRIQSAALFTSSKNRLCSEAPWLEKTLSKAMAATLAVHSPSGQLPTKRRTSQCLFLRSCRCSEFPSLILYDPVPVRGYSGALAVCSLQAEVVEKDRHDSILALDLFSLSIPILSTTLRGHVRFLNRHH